MPIGNLLITKGAVGNGRDLVYVMDGTNRKLAGSSTDGRTLTLHFVRDVQADARPVEFSSGPPQSPTVREMHRLFAPKPPP
jgi:hypothetical protein